MATIAPPAAGPMLRIRLKPMLFSDTAEGSSSRETMSPMVACHEGLCRAVPHPIRKVNPSNSQGDNQPSNAMNVRMIETKNMKAWATSMTRRRSKLSAKTPAKSEKIMIGSATDPCTSATIFCESDSEVISHAAPTA